MGGFVASYLFTNVSHSFGKSKFVFLLLLVLFICSVVILVPKRQYLSSYLPQSTNYVLSDRTYGFEKRIEELTTKDQCILSVYGWGVSENYLYSRRRPCTRFFLPNIVNQDWQKKEYARDIMENPPAAIAYTTVETDMDIQKFQTEVINISKIIKNCYVQDNKEDLIYLPKAMNIVDLRKCIIANSI
jgi:hypothetical protein